ncbi:hypothetical protein K440DRAFT_670217 [Wilcoxina mikolae CBS 423.85]|nr:hypothetical protein K440DRAFT_670217 [Wilcoxina mikolae CBS 423.85]
MQSSTITAFLTLAALAFSSAAAASESRKISVVRIIQENNNCHRNGWYCFQNGQDWAACNMRLRKVTNDRFKIIHSVNRCTPELSVESCHSFALLLLQDGSEPHDRLSDGYPYYYWGGQSYAAYVGLIGCGLLNGFFVFKPFRESDFLVVYLAVLVFVSTFISGIPTVAASMTPYSARQRISIEEGSLSWVFS